MLFLSAGTTDDLSMESIWDQTYDEIMLGDSCVERFLIVDIEGDWPCELDAFREFLRGLESSAG
jgi:hypothetical protein